MNWWGHRLSKNPNQKLQRFLPYPLINFQGRNLCNFWLGFWEKWWPHKLIQNWSDLYIILFMIDDWWEWQCSIFRIIGILTTFICGNRRTSNFTSTYLTRINFIPSKSFFTIRFTSLEGLFGQIEFRPINHLCSFIGLILFFIT